MINKSLSELTSLLNKYDALNQIIKCLNQIISKNKPYNLHLCTFTLHKFQEKNLNLNRYSNSDLQISSLVLLLLYINLLNDIFMIDLKRVGRN